MDGGILSSLDAVVDAVRLDGHVEIDVSIIRALMVNCGSRSSASVSSLAHNHHIYFFTSCNDW